MKEAREQEYALYNCTDIKSYKKEIDGDRSSVVAWEQGEVQGRELEARGGWVRRLQKGMGKVFGVMDMFIISTAVLVS